MKESKRNIHFLCTTNSPAVAPSINFGGRVAPDCFAQNMGPRRLSLTAASGVKPETVSFATTRCSEKGCVFPVSSPRHKMCTYHLHQQEEPVLFRSHQPTGLLLDPARSLPTEKEYDGSRKRDRRRMADIWEQFQTDGTT